MLQRNVPCHPGTQAALLLGPGIIEGFIACDDTCHEPTVLHNGPVRL